MKFEIDFIELAFLAEACIPPVPIARHYFWMKMIDKYYFDLSEDQRGHLLEWLTKSCRFDLEVKECKLFNNRYNPDNQYKIVDVKGGVHEVFKFEDRFWLTSTTFIPEGKIKEVDKLG